MSYVIKSKKKISSYNPLETTTNRLTPTLFQLVRE
jgi:hypothetical protein